MFQLTRSVRRAAVREVEVMATLVIRQVPRAATSVLQELLVGGVMTNRQVVETNVVLYLCTRQLFSPIANCAAQQVI